MKKIIFSLLTLLLMFMIIELSLSIFSPLYFMLQESNNTVTNDFKEIRILTVGESTTAFGMNKSYPRQLEGILSKKFKDIYIKVINRGIPASNTQTLVTNIKFYLKKYRPDIVLMMSGINDAKTLENYDKAKKVSIIDNFKIVKIYRHIKSLLEKDKLQIWDEIHLKLERLQDSLKLSSMSPEHITQIINLYQLQRYNEFINYLQQHTLLEEEFHNLQFIIGEAYFNLEDYPKAKIHYMKALKLKEKHALDKWTCYMHRDIINTVFYHQEINDFNSPNLSHFFLFNFLDFNIKNNFKLCPNIANNKVEMQFSLFERGHFDNERLKKLQKLKTYINKYSYLSKWKKRFNQVSHLKKPLKTELKFNHIDERHHYFENKTVRENHQKIIAKIKSEKSIPIIIQYPLLDPQPLIEYYDDLNIKVVPNVDNFTRILSQNPVKTVFTDLFAGKFGHCTPLGNKILAENIADYIKDDINKLIKAKKLNE